MNKNELMKKIQQLSFAKTDVELFLDTHKNCELALQYFRKTVEDLDEAMTEYQNKYGPIVKEAVKGDTWDWCDSPWPWHNNGEEKKTKEESENVDL